MKLSAFKRDPLKGSCQSFEMELDADVGNCSKIDNCLAIQANYCLCDAILKREMLRSFVTKDC